MVILSPQAKNPGFGGTRNVALIGPVNPPWQDLAKRNHARGRPPPKTLRLGLRVTVNEGSNNLDTGTGLIFP